MSRSRALPLTPLSISVLSAAVLFLSQAPAPAHAAQTPEALRGLPAGLELADDGRRAAAGEREKRATRPFLRSAWSNLDLGERGEWRVMWDSSTGVAQRMLGSGISAPGTVGSADAAEEHARRALRDYLEIVAPGASAPDFELAANHLDDTGLRTVSFLQHHGGVRVLGGQVNFRYRNDRLFMIGSEALPEIQAPAPRTRVATDTARARARAWIEDDFGPRSTPPSDASGPYILPVVSGPGDIEYHSVKSVHVDAPSIPAAWDVYVDSATGAPVARRQTLAFADGTVLFDVPVRRPGGERADLPASFLTLNAGGLEAVTDFFGRFSWGGDEPRDVTFSIEGPFVEVETATGDAAQGNRTFEPGAEEVFRAPNDEILDSQIAIFLHTNVAQDYVRQYTTNPWLEETLSAVANISESCNAFFDPQLDTINFFTEGVGQGGFECNNTGRLADVIYHEFGHAIHVNAIIPGVGAFEGAMSEGVSDYLAATITGDPGMGRGFFLANPEDALRHIDPESIGEPRRVFPQNFEGEQGTVHSDGLVIGQTLWQLREELIAEHGEAEGVAQADRIWYGIIQRATATETSYAEAIATDDTDGDALTGTPNSCIINRVFSDGGLVDDSAEVVTGVATPEVNGFEVTVPVIEPQGCEATPVGTAELTWRLRGDSDTGGTVQLEPGSGDLSAELPEQSEGSVIEYQVEVIYENGGITELPKNPADDHYQHFVGGDLEVVYETNFEDDPFQDGWESGAERGDDVWDWGEPGGAVIGGAPVVAYAGDRILATDLGHVGNGLYPSDTLTYVESPEIDVSDREGLRLQFRRWLAVEDGFFDQARIYANDELVWENANSDQGDDSDVHHIDREWRFQDLDLSAVEDDGTVQIRFELESDPGLELAGWAIDDLRVVSEPVEPECPDFDAGEVCDGECPPGCEPPPGDDDDGDESGASDVSGGCGCSAGAAQAAPGPGAAVLALLGLGAFALLRRRRRA